MQLKQAAKKTGIVLLVVAVLLTCLHFFIVYKSKQILNYIVLEASEGTYKLDSKKVRIHYYPLSISANRLLLYPVDSANVKTAYTVSADSVYVELAKLWPLITSKKVGLGNITIIHPQINIDNRDTSQGSEKSFNVALSTIQEALVNSLSAFNAGRCIIQDAGITYKKSKTLPQSFFINHVFLRIDSLHAVTKADTLSHSLQFAAYIRLFIDRPDIQLPDTSAKVYIQNLLLDTRQQVFSVNRFNMYQHNESGTIDSINLSNIHILHLNWGLWLKDGVIEIDSLRAFDGATFFDFSNKELFSLQNNNQQKKPVHIAVPLIIHAIEINKIAYGFRTGSNAGPLTMRLSGDSLAINEISLTNDAKRPLQIRNLAFKVTGFKNNYDSKINQSNFEKLVIDHNELELINYYRALNAKGLGNKSSITIPSLKVLNFSLDELLQYRLKADKLVLEKPSLVFDIQKSRQKRDADELVNTIMNSLKPSLDIKTLSIRDASIILLPNNAAAGKVTIENLNTEIDARQLLASRSVMDILASATAISSSAFRLTGPNIDLNIKRSALNAGKNGISLERLTGKIGSQINLDLYGVSMLDKSERFDVTKLQRINLDNVSVDRGSISIDLNSKANGVHKANTPVISINEVQTGSIDFELLNNGNKLTVKDVNVDASGIGIKDGITSWNAFAMKSGAVNFLTPGATVNAASMAVNQPGLFNIFSLNFVPAKPSKIDSFFIQKLSVNADFFNTAFHDLHAKEIVVSNPVLALNFSGNSKPGKKQLHLPDFLIDELKIEQPSFRLQRRDSTGTSSFLFNDGSIVLSKINSNKLFEKITTQALILHLSHPVINAGEKTYIPDEIFANAHDLNLNTKNFALSIKIDSAAVLRVPLKLEGKNLTEINNASAGLSAFEYHTGDSISMPYLLRHVNWWGSAVAVKQQMKNHALTIYNPYVSGNTSFISFDSLTMIPLISRDSFWNSTPVEKDYNTIRMGRTVLKNYSLTGANSDRKFQVSYVSADHFNFLTEKDKTHGPDTVTYRPLLANSIKAIPFKISIDTVEFSNGYLLHHVLPEKSKTQAELNFSDINGFLYHVKNYNYLPDDSLKFRLTSKLMGSGNLLVNFRQSYNDSMQTFNMKATMGFMNLSALNPLLVPMVSVRIDRGIVDSLNLNVDANDNLAFGSMDMRYHDLRVSLLRKGEGDYFLSRVYNWLLNVIVRSKDDSKREALYQERLRNKAIYNYWGKIAINGLLTNLGIKSSKRQVKKYGKALKQENGAKSRQKK